MKPPPGGADPEKGKTAEVKGPLITCCSRGFDEKNARMERKTRHLNLGGLDLCGFGGLEKKVR